MRLHLNDNKINIDYEIIKKYDLSLAIKELKLSIVCGHDGTNYSMIKNGSTDKFISLLTKMFNLFIFAQDIPTLLNISIIKPIL